MLWNRVRLLGSVALILAACQPSSPNAAQLTAVADSARAVARRIIDNSNKLDFAAAFQDYSADADARYVENGMLYPSLEALKKAYAELTPGLELVANSVDSWDVQILGAEAASVTLPIHLRIKGKGRPEYAGQYVWSGIVQRRGGRWQLVQSHESWPNAEKVFAAIMPAPGDTKP
jgi:hypothetical protein